MPPGGRPLAKATPPSTGGGQPHETIQHAVARMLQQGYSRDQVYGQLTHHWGYDAHTAASLINGSHAPNPEETIQQPKSYLQPGAYTPSKNVIDDQGVEDFIKTQALRATVNAAAALHGKAGAPWDVGKGLAEAALARHIQVKNGKTVLTGNLDQRRQAAGLLALPGTGNAVQKGLEDVLGIPTGAVSAVMDPGAFVHGMAKYYGTNPLTNLRQDPVGFGLNYLLPAVSAGGSILGRAAAVGDTAGMLGTELPEGAGLADIARTRERGALQNYTETGSLPEIGPVKKAGLLARSALRSPVAPERTFQVGDEQFTAPASHNYATNLFHRYVTDRLINHALEGGHDILGFRSKVGRHVRANLRVRHAIQNADLSHLEHETKGLSAAQEHAAYILAKGHTAESYARYHEAGAARAAELADAESQIRHENGAHLTKIAAQYLKPGEEDPKVLRAADAMRRAINHRQEFYGYTTRDINHSIGSHWYAIHTRAEGLPNLHDELASIMEQHGPPAESPRHALDQRIAELQRGIDRAENAARERSPFGTIGPDVAGALKAELSRIQGLPHDIAYVQHEISRVDQRIHDLGPEHYRGRMTAHPDNLLGTHHELLLERSRLEDMLNSLQAHQRHRDIHAMFEEKGQELRGHVLNNPARQALIDVAHQHGVDPTSAIGALDARALRWAREHSSTTREFYEQYLHGVRAGGEVPDEALFQRNPGDERPIHPDEVRAALRGVNWSVFRKHDVKAADVANMIAEGQEGRFWYEDSAREILSMAHGDKELADRIAQVVAIYSPQRAPLPNMQLAINAYHQFLQDGEVTSIGTRSQMEKANAVFRGEPWAGRKTDRFYANMIEDIDPAKYRELYKGGEVTNDIWMARLFGLKSDTPTPREYEVMQQAVQRIADRLGWKPKQVQAALWIAKKARTEGTSIAEAGSSFAEALRKEHAVIPFEAAPGEGAPAEIRDAYAKLTPEQQRSYLGAKVAAVHDFLDEAQIFGRVGNREGPGVFEGNVNPGASLHVAASRGKGSEMALRVAPAGKATLDFVASAVGRALHQDAAAWFKGFDRKNIRPTQWTGMKWDIGRTITDDEAKALDQAFRRAGADIAIVHETDGAHFLNLDPEALPNRDFQALVHRTVNDVSPQVDGTLRGFAHDGNYIERNGYGDHLERGATGSGGSDLQGAEHPGGQRPDLQAAASRLAARSAEVDQRFLGAEGPALEERVGGEVRGAFNPATREISVGEHATADTFQHEVLHAIRPSLDDAQMRALEDHYGVQGGQWTRDQEERFVTDMQAAARGEAHPVVQSVFNASLVAPPEAFYLPFELETKKASAGPGGYVRAASPMGLGPAAREATHEFTGRILEHGGHRTKASQLAKSSFSKASHWRSMEDLHQMLWALSKETPEEAGYSRFNLTGSGRRGAPVPIRDIRQIPPELKEAAYRQYPGEILEGEAPDEIAKQLVDAWTAQPEPGENVRYLNADFLRPLQPESVSGFAGSFLRFVNGINSAFRFGRFLGPSYARWLPQNLVLNLTQQGPFIFRNAAKMMTELQHLDPVIYKQIADSVSFGSVRAFETEGAGAKVTELQHKVANAWAHVNDHIPRMLSFLHEAQRAGFRTAEDWTTLMTDPRLESARQGIIQRANKEPIDYGAMTARERIVMKSLFAYWPWVRAASLWALRFPLEHPYQMAVYEQMGMVGRQKIQQFWAKEGGVAPPYLEGDYPAKSGPIDTSAVNPWSQLAQDMQVAVGLSAAHPEEAGTAFGMISPTGKPAMELITGRDEFGNVPKGGVLSDAANRMAKTFQPFSLLQMAQATQTGATPKGTKAAVLKWLGDPQMEGYDYKKGAAQGLKALSSPSREQFAVEHNPGLESQPLIIKQLLIRLSQIGGSKNPKPNQVRERAAAAAAAGWFSLSDANSALVTQKLKPLSAGEVAAERARLRSIQP